MIPNVVLNLIKGFNMNLQNLQNIKTPDEMAQYLLNLGKVNQEQVNQAKQMWNNPQTRQRINAMSRRT